MNLYVWLYWTHYVFLCINLMVSERTKELHKSRVGKYEKSRCGILPNRTECWNVIKSCLKKSISFWKIVNVWKQYASHSKRQRTNHFRAYELYKYMRNNNNEHIKRDVFCQTRTRCERLHNELQANWFMLLRSFTS